MTYKAYTEKLDQLKQLVRLNATGSPSDLSNKLKVSERSARRMIGHLKDDGLNIKYSRKNNSYYYHHL